MQADFQGALSDAQFAALSAAWSDLDAGARETLLRVADGLRQVRP